MHAGRKLPRGPQPRRSAADHDLVADLLDEPSAGVVVRAGPRLAFERAHRPETQPPPRGRDRVAGDAIGDGHRRHMIERVVGNCVDDRLVDADDGVGLELADERGGAEGVASVASQDDQRALSRPAASSSGATWIVSARRETMRTRPPSRMPSTRRCSTADSASSATSSADTGHASDPTTPTPHTLGAGTVRAVIASRPEGSCAAVPCAKAPLARRARRRAADRGAPPPRLPRGRAGPARVV